MFSIKNFAPIMVEAGEQKKEFKNFNICDHDFFIHVSVTAERGTKFQGRILSGTNAYNWSIFVTSSDEVQLRFGNRIRWEYEFPLGRLASAETLRLKIRRRGCKIEGFCNGEETSFQLPENYRVPGNAICLVSDPIHYEMGRISFEFHELFIPDYASVVLPSDKDINLVTVFYGQNFAEMAANIMFPSLTRHNLERPFFRKKHLTHQIYCREADLQYLDRHIERLKEAGITCSINTSIFPAEASLSELWFHIYRCWLDCFEQSATAGRLCLAAMPDHVIGYGLEGLIRRMSPYDYVVAGHVRIVKETALPLLIQAFQGNTTPFANNSELVAFSINDHPHPLALYGLSHYNPYWWGEKHTDHCSVYFKVPPPLVFDPAADLVNVMLEADPKVAYQTIDHEIVEYALHHSRLKFVSDSDEFFWAELTEGSEYKPPVKSNYWSPSARLFAKTELTFRLPRSQT